MRSSGSRARSSPRSRSLARGSSSLSDIPVPPTVARSDRLPALFLAALTFACAAAATAADDRPSGGAALADAAAPAATTSGTASQARMTGDASAGAPIVVHVIVALCDNEHQGIVPVPKGLGNGRDPASNLYWGARFGVRAYLSREAGWKTREVSRPPDGRILERAVFFDRIERSGRAVPVYIVADAWD